MILANVTQSPMFDYRPYLHGTRAQAGKVSADKLHTVYSAIDHHGL